METQLLKVCKRHVLDVFPEVYDISEPTVLRQNSLRRVGRRVESIWIDSNRHRLHYKQIRSDIFSIIFVGGEH